MNSHARMLKSHDIISEGEFFECRDCSYFGQEVFEGNAAFVDFLAWKKQEAFMLVEDSPQEKASECNSLLVIEQPDKKIV